MNPMVSQVRSDGITLSRVVSPSNEVHYFVYTQKNKKMVGAYLDMMDAINGEESTQDTLECQMDWILDNTNSNNFKENQTMLHELLKSYKPDISVEEARILRRAVNGNEEDKELIRRQFGKLIRKITAA